METALILLGSTLLAVSCFGWGYHVGRKQGRLDATRAQITRVDSMLHRWRQEQRP